jgi:hypothetical protein
VDIQVVVVVTERMVKPASLPAVVVSVETKVVGLRVMTAVTGAQAPPVRPVVMAKVPWHRWLRMVFGTLGLVMPAVWVVRARQVAAVAAVAAAP